MACAAPPSTHERLCGNAAGCVEAFTQDSAYVDGMSIECEPRSSSEGVESAYSQRMPAPAASGLNGTSLVTLVTVQENRYVFGGAYLVAELAEGSCLVDVVHPWDLRPSYVETTFDTRWEPAQGGFRLRVQSRRIMHMELDSEERADGESDVRSDHCQRITYDVADGRFKRVAESSSPGSCDG